MLVVVALLTGVLTASGTVVVATTRPALAVGNYDNARLADIALSFVGEWGGEACREAGKLDANGVTVGGYNGGECRTFANCVIFRASGGTQYPTSSYFPSLDAIGDEVTSLDALRKGDIVQVGEGEHTYFIVSRVSGNTFNVVDSNHAGDKKVMNYNRLVALNANNRAFRLGTVSTSPPPPPPTEPRYQPFAGDFNGDGVDDVGLRRVATGTFYIRYGPAPSFSTQITHTWAGGYHLEPFAGDFNGDDIDDIGLRRISTGELYIRYGPAFDAQVSHLWVGTENYQPLGADLNGDDIDDIVLRKVSTGTFYIRYGPGPHFGPQTTYTWAGGAHLEPYAGDFNGDGVDDLGLRRTSTGELYIRFGPAYDTQVSHLWAGSTNYQPFAGDFNGDGTDDIGLRKVSTGMLYIRYGPGPAFGPQVTHQWAYG